MFIENKCFRYITNKQLAKLCLPPAFTLVSCSAHSSTLKKVALCSSETSVDFQCTTRRLSQKIVLFITTAVRTSNPTTNSMELSPSWEAASRTATQEFPNILCNPKVHYVFIRALHWSLSWARSIHSILSHPAFLRSILILSSHLRLGAPNCLFPGFLTKILHVTYCYE
jgi:hypothetical protein